MGLPKRKYKSIGLTVNEDIKHFTINDLLNNEQKTEYKHISNSYDPTFTTPYIIYRFRLKNGMSYDVEFYSCLFSFKNIKLINNVILPDKYNEEISFGNIIGLRHTKINNEIFNLDEISEKDQHEILNKFIYLVKEFIKNNPEQEIYFLMKSIEEKCQLKYKNILKNIFSNEFIEYETKEEYIYISKKISKNPPKNFFEGFDITKPIEYKKITRLNPKFPFLEYTFTSNKGFSYDVEFYKRESIYNDICIVIGFIPSEKSGKYIIDDNINKNPYFERTYRFEQYELFRKIGFLVKEFIKNNTKYNIYGLTKKIDKTDLSIYRYIYNKFFSNIFNEYESEDMFYYIKK